MRFEHMAQDHTLLKQQWFDGQTVLPCYAFTSCIEWQSDPCLHLSASGTEFQTRYNPAADLFMGTKTVLAGGRGTPDRRSSMNAFIGILQVLIRDSGGTSEVARVQATTLSCHRFPVRRPLSCALDMNFTPKLFFGQLIKKFHVVNWTQGTKPLT